MIRQMTILIVCCLVLLGGFVCCQKGELDSFLVGTSWECVEEPEILIFNDNSSGIYYVKSATDDVYDEVFSSFDFTYEVSGKNIKIQIFFSHFDSLYDFVIENDNLLTCGRFNYKKIQHKSAHLQNRGFD